MSTICLALPHALGMPRSDLMCCNASCYLLYSSSDHVCCNAFVLGIRCSTLRDHMCCTAFCYPRSTLSDIVCFNASCPWYSLLFPFATTCVAMSPAMFSSTSSYHLCCDALCYISVFLAITCVAYFSFWILASCVRRALPHPLLMLALQCAIPLLPHAFMDRLRTCVSPMPLPLMYQLWYTPHISHLTLHTYISHFTLHTSHLRILACQEEFPDPQVARQRLQPARK